MGDYIDCGNYWESFLYEVDKYDVFRLLLGFGINRKTAKPQNLKCKRLVQPLRG